MTADPLVEQSEEAFAAGSFTTRRVERILHIAAGVGSLVVAVQAFFAALGSVDAGVFHIPFVAVIFTSLAALLVSCFTGKGLTITGTILAIVYPAVLIMWPLATQHVADPGLAQPWIWYVTNIATLAAVIVFPLVLQVIWTIALPFLFFMARMIQVEFASEYVAPNLFDLSFGLCLGVILLFLVRTVRAVGRGVDEARAAALAQYTQAAAAEASEAERISMAALMHDSVMAALIAAAKATTDRERALTVVMASEALTGFADAESDERMALGRPVSATTISQDLQAALRSHGSDIVVADPADTMVPSHVARALTLSATQAITNSIQHAQGRGLEVRIEASNASCQVTVQDQGPGFDVRDIPDDRLGIRASIFARMAAVGGTAEVISEAGKTIVTSRWQR